jgi:hypothetical protein
MRWRVGIAVFAVVVANLLVAGPVNATGPEDDHGPSIARWSARCFFAENARVDPIDYYADSPSPHMHTFLGFTAPTDTMAPADLQANQDPANCTSPDLTEFGSDPVIG